jgi:hypothetical protein
MLIGHDLDARLRAIGAVLRDDLLELPPAGAQPARQLRVSDGIVFFRDAQSNGKFLETSWRAANPQLLLAYFVENSPVATWMRAAGADILQAAVTSFGR